MSSINLQRIFLGFFAIAVVLVIAILVVRIGSSEDESGSEGVDLPSTERPVAPPGKRTVVSAEGYVIINDVTAQAVETYEGGVHVLQITDTYSVLYYAHADHFLISLLDDTNPDTARAAAEQALHEYVGVSDRELCTLAVDVVIPPYIDFMRAGSYGLSFCPGSVSLP